MCLSWVEAPWTRDKHKASSPLHHSPLSLHLVRHLQNPYPCKGRWGGKKQISPTLLHRRWRCSGMCLQCSRLLFRGDVFEIGGAFERAKLQYFDICYGQSHP